VRRRICLLAAASGLFAARADAHSFHSGADFYAQFLEGASVVVMYPETLLPLLALGVLISLWHPEGMVRAWPAFLAGQVIGIPLASLVGTWVVPVVLGAGILTGALAALLTQQVRAAVLGVSLGLGALVTATCLEGHGFLELPVFIHLGVLAAANLVTVWVAGIAHIALAQVEALWMRILWRIVGSWLAAIMTILFAFTFTAA